MKKLRTTAIIIAIGSLMGVGITLQAKTLNFKQSKIILKQVGHMHTKAVFIGQKYSKQAKISLKQARLIAEKQGYKGRITTEELEKEKGGSGLRYSFDIAHKGTIHEVGIDAKTGKVLENSIESNKKERKEKG